MRLPVLDGYRAASIIFVLFGHLIPLGPKAWELNECAARLGMTMFFSLSGFLIATQLRHDARVGQFLLRRMARIWPLALAYTGIVYLVLQYEPEKFLASSFFAIDYLHQFIDEWNGHLWSLCVEVHFYIGIAIAVAIGGRHAIWCVWPLCFLVTLLRIATGAEISIVTHLRVDEILVGACVATLYRVRFGCFSPLLLFVALLATLASCHPDLHPVQYLRPYFTAALLISVLYQQPASWIARIAKSRPAKYVADVSYALYVIHPAFTHGWFAGTGTFDKYAIKRPIALALTFALAHLSTFYWERLWITWAKSASPRELTTQP